MIYGLFGDVHSNFDALFAVLKQMEKEGVKEYFCVGDIAGYASEPGKCIDILRNLNCQICAGNHDYGVVDKISIKDFNDDAHKAIVWQKEVLNTNDKQFLNDLPLVVKNNRLVLVHGTLHNPGKFNYMIYFDEVEQTFNMLENKVCFIGHTHVPVAFFYKNGDISYSSDDIIDLSTWDKVIINTGSVGQPRDKDPRASYVLFDTDKNKIFFRRVKYNVENAVKKIYEAGLPPRNGDRLLYSG